MRRVLAVGNSDGIGLEVTKQLLARGDRVVGASRSELELSDSNYEHYVVDVGTEEASSRLRAIVEQERQLGGAFDVCIYFAGIGHGFDVDDLAGDRRVFDVNVGGLLRTVEEVLPSMAERGSGHIVALASIADSLLVPDAVSYPASKIAMTSYLRSLHYALKPRGIAVTNIRFGFVDTKMADAPVKPFMVTREKAAAIVIRTLETRPRVVSRPRRANWIAKAVLGLEWAVSRFGGTVMGRVEKRE